jgi:CMP-N-acetylneuraminic acid synthetase
MTDKIVALLPMKANSERVKGKNFKFFAGKPLYRWILDSLLEVSELAEIVINTDARAQLSESSLVSSSRISIHDRPEDICGDLVSMNTIIEHDIKNVDADIYLMTHTTNPLLSAKTIRNALHAFRVAYAKKEADSLFTVNKVQTRFYRHDCSPVNHDPDNLLRTQDLEPWFEENSNLYIFTKNSFLSTGARIGKKPMMFETPKLESIDIDTPSDWEFASIAAQTLNACPGASN